MAARDDAAGSRDAFFAATAEQARRVIEAEEGSPTYDAGIAFQSLAMSLAASQDALDQYPDEEPMALYLIWGALTDAMDAPGRGSPEQDALAVRDMKRAAAEWLAVVDTPKDRAVYCDRWGMTSAATSGSASTSKCRSASAWQPGVGPTCSLEAFGSGSARE